jgi:hypothetical protein
MLTTQCWFGRADSGPPFLSCSSGREKSRPLDLLGAVARNSRRARGLPEVQKFPDAIRTLVLVVAETAEP